MKRILMILALVTGLALYASAGEEYRHDASALPEAARTTVKNHFKATVSLVKIEKTLGHIDEYEVILTDGTEVSFDRNGNLESVETAASSQVPASLIPQPITDYVKANHKGTRIVGLDIERNGYEIELSNGIDIKFDRSGAFKRYD